MRISTQDPPLKVNYHLNLFTREKGRENHQKENLLRNEFY